MQKNNISSMVEAGILSSISIVFAIINIYLPMMGVFLNMLWPVPLVLLGIRHGLKWSGLSLVTAGIIIALIVSPLQSIMLVSGLGFIGIVLGWSIRKGNSPFKTIIWGSIASLLSKIAVLLISFLLIGANPLNLDAETTNRITEQVIDYYQKIGIPEKDIQNAKDLINLILHLMIIAIPAILIISAVIDTIINFIVAKAILKRLGTYMDDIPPFRNWVISQHILLLFGLSLIGFSYFQQYPNSLSYYISVNGFFLFSVPILIQGTSIVFYFIHKKNWPSFVKGIFITLLFINQIVAFFTVFIGLFDFIFDFRKIRPPRK